MGPVVSSSRWRQGITAKAERRRSFELLMKKVGVRSGDRVPRSPRQRTGRHPMFEVFLETPPYRGPVRPSRKDSYPLATLGSFSSLHASLGIGPASRLSVLARTRQAWQNSLCRFCGKKVNDAHLVSVLTSKLAQVGVCRCTEATSIVPRRRGSSPGATRALRRRSSV